MESATGLTSSPVGQTGKEACRDDGPAGAAAPPSSEQVETRSAALGAGKGPVLLLLACLAAYFNSFSGSFVFDDHTYLLDDPAVGRLLAGHMVPRPVVSVTLTLNYWLDGLNVRGYHLFNFAVHLLAGLTLFGIVRRTLLLDRFSARYHSRAEALALAIALIWVVHPLQTQSVTYVIQRCESLMGLFYLLTLYCVLRRATSLSPLRWYAAAVLSCGLGAGCKEVMVTAFLVILLYDWVFLAPSLRQLFRRRGWLYAALALPPLVAPLWLAASGVLTQPQGVLGFGVRTSTPWTYLLTQPGVILHYLRLAVWPVGLCLDYLDWPVCQTLADCWPAACAVLALLAVTAWGLYRRSWLGFLGAWFFLILRLPRASSPSRTWLSSTACTCPWRPWSSLSLLRGMR